MENNKQMLVLMLKFTQYGQSADARLVQNMLSHDQGVRGNKMAKKTKKIDVEGSEITILTNQEQDYIFLTDMVRDIENGSALIENWLRNKNSIEF